MKKIISAALAATVFLASPASAIVTFDTLAGTGFVGKGDVQLAFGWNNAQLQARAGAVTFTYNAEDTYDVTCEWTTTTGRGTTIIHDVTNNRIVSVNSSIAYEARRNGGNGQITGFNLNGFGTTLSSGTVPVVGAACPQGGGIADPDPEANDGVITEVVETGSLGGLYVNYGGNAVLLQ